MKPKFFYYPILSVVVLAILLPSNFVSATSQFLVSLSLAPTKVTANNAVVKPEIKKPVKKKVVKKPLKKQVIKKAAPKIILTKPTTVAPKPVVGTPPLEIKKVTPTNEETAALTVRGIIDLTNAERTSRNLNPFTEDATLAAMAHAKAKDLFAKQYFDHVSPSGVGPSDLARENGYAYVLVGENLALGNFGSDRAVVTGWMNSPGHRANILRAKYSEIGVAVIEDIYQGHRVWIAVQEFGTPLSSCPAVDVELKARIDAANHELKLKETALKTKQAEIQAAKTVAAHNQRVNEYNELVQVYNAEVAEVKAVAAQYNAQVKQFNACVK